ncbi:ROK family transcriptional regulator [Psychromarinibacter sp. S121]|uniref:ROK family transcriptional regulator n=1 Tax=Psychromarinibacter sp. S121 TaxID=3415127 RepID=UPI003C7C03F4
MFRSLVEHGVSTRPRIGEALGLSRPTMSAAISELEKLGYVESVGHEQGALGRKAAKYRAGPGAGHVIAVDAGSTHVRIRVSTLDRRVLHSRVYSLPSSQQTLGDEISQAVAQEMAELEQIATEMWGPLRTVGIAIPSRVVKDGSAAETTGQMRIFSKFRAPECARVVLENNVNCAAVAEHLYGNAKDTGSFAYVQIGLKIGMGLMLSGQLVRGRNGAAGEIGHISFPFAPGATPIPGEVERYLGTEGLIDRVRASWPSEAGPPPQDTNELMTRAGNSDPVALAQVEQQAHDIAAVVATCVSVVDPGLVILGGGLGSSELLPERVSAAATRLSYPVEVRSSTLGSDATALGIEKLAIDQALQDLLPET